MNGPIHHCDPDNACPVLLGAPCEGPNWRETPETWQVRAAFRALSEVGWNCLTPEERAVINKWEGR
jgi:hypothetical protein